jgi:uncharacterized protein YodC (DUF2158 family)
LKYKDLTKRRAPSKPPFLLHLPFNSFMSEGELEHYERFNIGDTVVLKSLSPTMTVASTGDDEILCVWYCEVQERFRKRKFHAGMLKKAPSPTDDPPPDAAPLTDEDLNNLM